jgi:hypothetical protein
MPRATVALREGLVGDAAKQVLQESVLAVLRGARIGLDAEHLLADKRSQERIQLLGRQAAESRQCLLCERLAEHRRVLEHRRSISERPSSRAAIRAWSVSGTSRESTSATSR